MQNSLEKEDLRVRRSRKLLQAALIELTVEKKGFGSVTVRDITERAMVNRSTFYRHYLDKCDLVEQYMDEVYDLLTTDEKVTVKASAGQSALRIPVSLLNLLQHVQTHADFYRIMLGADGDPGFTERFRQNLDKRRRSLLLDQGAPPEIDAMPLEMRLKYVSYASTGAIVWWLENDQPCSVEELTAWISRLSYPLWTGDSGSSAESIS